MLFVGPDQDFHCAYRLKEDRHLLNKYNCMTCLFSQDFPLSRCHMQTPLQHMWPYVSLNAVFDSQE